MGVKTSRLLELAAVAAIAAVAVLVPEARAQGPAIPIGYDVSYPQCGDTFPAGAAFSIVGVNAGLPFGANPCLATELQWAGAGAQLYANTADPGPGQSSHWPDGQTSPELCNTGSSPGDDTTTCAYDYGWNAAQDGYQDAVDGYIAAGLLPAGSTRTPQANVWWLDVESANSWETTVANNVAALQGEIDSLESLGVATVGFYASPGDWQAITGGSTQFASYPFWLPGAASLADAASRCSQKGANGGPLTLVQFPGTATSADIRCADVRRLRATVTVIKKGAGTVRDSQGHIVCGKTCTYAMYVPVGGLILKASPAKGYVFAGWSGACSGKRTCRLTLSPAARLKVRAGFAKQRKRKK
ncbi:MAG TPA: hypothetical protein VKR79_05055 [Gaiellaceae bacterium]|nr:hypothetical protein [Gaiellaceae bacterium]